jgi:ankyrin repeat protein
MAAARNNIEIVRLLLAKGADASAADKVPNSIVVVANLTYLLSIGDAFHCIGTGKFDYCPNMIMWSSVILSSGWSDRIDDGHGEEEH